MKLTTRQTGVGLLLFLFLLSLTWLAATKDLLVGHRRCQLVNGIADGSFL